MAEKAYIKETHHILLRDIHMSGNPDFAPLESAGDSVFSDSSNAQSPSSQPPPVPSKPPVPSRPPPMPSQPPPTAAQPENATPLEPQSTIPEDIPPQEMQQEQVQPEQPAQPQQTQTQQEKPKGGCAAFFTSTFMKVLARISIWIVALLLIGMGGALEIIFIIAKKSRAFPEILFSIYAVFVSFLLFFIYSLLFLSLLF